MILLEVKNARGQILSHVFEQEVCLDLLHHQVGTSFDGEILSFSIIVIFQPGLKGARVASRNPTLDIKLN